MNQAPTATASLMCQCPIIPLFYKVGLINQAPTRINHIKTQGINGKGLYKGDRPPISYILNFKLYCLFLY